MFHRRSGEEGQVMVLLAVGIVALLGFAALAVDGGMYYADRRHDQNAADSAALAGAGAAAEYFEVQGITKSEMNCGSTRINAAIETAELAAMQNAAANGFTLDKDTSDGHGIQVICEDAGGLIGKQLRIHVMITTITKTSFAQLFFGGDMNSTVEAVSRVEPGLDGAFAYGYAILGLLEECKNADEGVIFDGMIDVYVETGGIFSNACLKKAGASGAVYADGPVQYFTELKPADIKNIDPYPAHVDFRIKLDLDPPDCSSLDVLSMPDPKEKVDEITLSPGIYPDGIQVRANKTLYLEPGLYCLQGDFEVESQSIIAVDGTDDEGVTLYLQLDSKGKPTEFKAAGNAQVDLRAPRAGTEGAPPAVPGLLIYMDKSNEGQIKLCGNSDTSYRGTVYAPTGRIEVGGETSLLGVLSTQIVGYSVKVNGNPGMKIHFDENDLLQQDLPSALDLYK